MNQIETTKVKATRRAPFCTAKSVRMELARLYTAMKKTAYKKDGTVSIEDGAKMGKILELLQRAIYSEEIETKLQEQHKPKPDLKVVPNAK